MKLRIPGVFAISVFVMLVYSLFSATVQAQFSQQAKLVGTDAIGSPNFSPQQGLSAALSGDGNTAIVGGLSAEAAWVFTRSGAAWGQQVKLVGTEAIGSQPQQGGSVAVSGDGNTAIVGGRTDDDVGAAWVYTRSSGGWSQQAKLVGTDFTNPVSVSLSGDGNTAIVGGLSAEAAWVFTQPVFAGTPGKANCYGQSVSALAQQYGGFNNATAALGYPSTSALQNAVEDYCEG